MQSAEAEPADDNATFMIWGTEPTISAWNSTALATDLKKPLSVARR
jgi:hypothetical protein